MLNKMYVFCLLFLVACSNTNISNHPNILMISVDDLNDWVGIYEGHPNSHTPNIDQLGLNAVVFKNAYSQSPLCGPSRASILSGLRPTSSGIYGQITDNQLKDFSTKNDILLMPEFFKKHGYKTFGVGKISHGHMPDGVFDESGGRVKGFGPKPVNGAYFNWNKNGTSTDWGAFPISDSLMPDFKSANWIKKRLQETHKDPFFMAVGFLRPHVPWYVPQKWFDLHPLDEIKLPPYFREDLDDLPDFAFNFIYGYDMMPTTEWAIKNKQWKKIVQSYLASISFVDHYVGEVIDALNNSIYKENTIIVLFSDHGYRIGEKGIFAKQALWDEAVKVPLIIKPPNFNKSIEIKNIVELIDIYPTLIDLAGLPNYKKNEGKSLVPLIENKNNFNKNFSLTTFGWGNHSISLDNYKYIVYRDSSEELYYLKNDPNSWKNLANNKSYDSIKIRLRNLLPKRIKNDNEYPLINKFLDEKWLNY